MLTSTVISFGDGLGRSFAEGTDFACTGSLCVAIAPEVDRTFKALQHRLNSALDTIGSRTTRLVADGKIGGRTLAAFIEVGTARTGHVPTKIRTVRDLAVRAFDAVLELETPGAGTVSVPLPVAVPIPSPFPSPIQPTVPVAIRAAEVFPGADAEPGFWTRNTKIAVGVGGGLVLLGTTVLLASRWRRE